MTTTNDWMHSTQSDVKRDAGVYRVGFVTLDGSDRSVVLGDVEMAYDRRRRHQFYAPGIWSRPQRRCRLVRSGGSTSILFTILVILAFFVVFAGHDGIGEVMSWYK